MNGKAKVSKFIKLPLKRFWESSWGKCGGYGKSYRFTIIEKEWGRETERERVVEDEGQQHHIWRRKSTSVSLIGQFRERKWGRVEKEIESGRGRRGTVHFASFTEWEELNWRWIANVVYYG